MLRLLAGSREIEDARQARKWPDDVKTGQAADMDYIVGGLEDFEGLAL